MQTMSTTTTCAMAVRPLTDNPVAHAIFCPEDSCPICDDVSQLDLAMAARELLEFVRDTTPSECDVRELNGGRRYWCSTHSEYGTGDGCAGEMGRELLKKYGVH